MSPSSRFKQQLSGIGKGRNWQAVWDDRVSSLEKILGKSSGAVYHSPTPFYLGGDADILIFPYFVGGLTYVTADLTGGETDQIPNEDGNYELGMCTREEAVWAASLISRLSRYTLEAILNAGETMDCPAFGDSKIVALLFASIDGGHFEVLGSRASLLLCLGITAEELAFHREQGSEALVLRLKENGVFPFTDLERQSTV